jgi:hypothetical protein
MWHTIAYLCTRSNLGKRQKRTSSAMRTGIGTFASAAISPMACGYRTPHRTLFGFVNPRCLEHKNFSIRKSQNVDFVAIQRRGSIAQFKRKII